jgi:mono/diheme cytochrome c family protein
MQKHHARSRWSNTWGAARSAGGAIATLVALGGAWSVASTAASVAGERAAAKQVERGRYLVKTTGCNDCHTPGYIESAGRLEESRWLVGNSLGWQGPWGTTYPANLRLLTQGLTADQWLLVARRQMRPPMPWFALREMTNADLLAIYYFTRSLGPAGTAAPAFIPPGKVAQTPIVKIPG